MKFYISHKERRECLVNTWHFCIAIGRWYALIRVFGVETGVTL